MTDWRVRLKQLGQAEVVGWPQLVALAKAQLDFLQTQRLDQLLQARFPKPPDSASETDVFGEPVRLAILGSSTVAHLHAAIRVAALRRSFWVTTYETGYGQYLQELLDGSSGLHSFHPDVMLLALDARHLTSGVEQASDAAAADQMLDATVARLRQCWRLARDTWQCTVLQQTALDVLPPVLGENEHRLPGSASAMITRLNARLRAAADEDRVEILALDSAAAQDGIRSWHSPDLWHRSKQEVNPAAAPMYGELVARLIAAQRGRSAKCLVLDLDNTLWGGVIGDDGLEGIILGQNSALGEAFVALQGYAVQLARRGVILAVCSKNDEATALAAFEMHPEMVLRRSDIACFVVNWSDKASNLRLIAQELNIGLNTLVFLDDNPFERNLVRQELPEVSVPEWPEDDPASVPEILADAGYFESLALTDADRSRTEQYQANMAREALQSTATDLRGFLRGLDMKLIWNQFNQIGLKRIVQLINKTNQFNLTTRRYTEEEIVAVMHDPASFGLQLRLLDRFGDNGIIAIIIGRVVGHDCFLDTWLMSCRVLGRQVEESTLNLVVAQAATLGAQTLVGVYRPTAKNGMVAGHYAELGFVLQPLKHGTEDQYALDIGTFRTRAVLIETVEGT